MKNNLSDLTEFSNNLIAFLEKNLGDKSEEFCRYSSAMLMHESINVLMQNAPNKIDFREKAQKLFLAILDKFPVEES